MNIYSIIILATIIISFILGTIADGLNLKNLKKQLPDEFKDTYDIEKYKTSQDYTIIKTKFGFITSIFELSVILIFWFAGGFNWLDEIVRTGVNYSILRGLVYIGILVISNSILSLPFSIYSTFVIEEKFGFNKTTPKIFILDIIKSLFLAILLGGSVLALVLYIFETGGEFTWIYGWATVLIIGLVIQFIAPTWIMPLFNKFTPLEEGELKNRIIDYAKSVNFPLKNVFVIDGSKRSSKSNAFFTGFGKNKRIALFDTLIEKHSVKELVAILAHEIGHYKKKHIQINMLISFIHSGILFYLLSLFLNEKGLFDAFYMNETSVYSGLIFFGMLFSAVDLFLSVFLNILSRKNEFEADEYAVKTTNLKGDMVNALKKLSKDNLSNLTPHPFYVFIHYSHPPVLDRIRQILKIS
ncbi:MAG: M48 family metallopeptidase [bacterium]